MVVFTEKHHCVRKTPLLFLAPAGGIEEVRDVLMRLYGTELYAEITVCVFDKLALLAQIISCHSTIW